MGDNSAVGLVRNAGPAGDVELAARGASAPRRPRGASAARRSRGASAVVDAQPSPATYTSCMQHPRFQAARPVTPSAAWGEHLDPKLAGILAATSSFTVRQHVKLEELSASRCCGSNVRNQPNTYTVYAGAKDDVGCGGGFAEDRHESLVNSELVPLLHVQEVSEDCSRYMCMGCRPFRLEVKPHGVPPPLADGRGATIHALEAEVAHLLPAEWEHWEARYQLAEQTAADFEYYGGGSDWVGKGQPTLWNVVRNGYRCAESDLCGCNQGSRFSNDYFLHNHGALSTGAHGAAKLYPEGFFANRYYPRNLHPGYSRGAYIEVEHNDERARVGAEPALYEDEDGNKFVPQLEEVLQIIDDTGVVEPLRLQPGPPPQSAAARGEDGRIDDGDEHAPPQEASGEPDVAGSAGNDAMATAPDAEQMHRSSGDDGGDADAGTGVYSDDFDQKDVDAITDACGACGACLPSCRDGATVVAGPIRDGSDYAQGSFLVGALPRSVSSKVVAAIDQAFSCFGLKLRVGTGQEPARTHGGTPTNPAVITGPKCCFGGYASLCSRSKPVFSISGLSSSAITGASSARIVRHSRCADMEVSLASMDAYTLEFDDPATTVDEKVAVLSSLLLVDVMAFENRVQGICGETPKGKYYVNAGTCFVGGCPISFMQTFSPGLSQKTNTAIDGRSAEGPSHEAAVKRKTAQALSSGSRVIVDMDRHGMQRGTVRFAFGQEVPQKEFGRKKGPTVFGQTMIKAGLWIGIELDEPKGEHDGTVRARSYFSCKAGHGTFVPPHKVAPEEPQIDAEFISGTLK